MFAHLCKNQVTETTGKDEKRNDEQSPLCPQGLPLFTSTSPFINQELCFICGFVNKRSGLHRAHFYTSSTTRNPLQALSSDNRNAVERSSSEDVELETKKKLCYLEHADDLVFLFESPKHVQRALDWMERK